jgi:hypothetical protein
VGRTVALGRIKGWVAEGSRVSVAVRVGVCVAVGDAVEVDVSVWVNVGVDGCAVSEAVGNGRLGSAVVAAGAQPTRIASIKTRGGTKRYFPIIFFILTTPTFFYT